MTRLFVDLGNSRLKWARDPQPWQPQAVLHRDRDIASLLDEIWRSLPPPQSVALVSVAAESIRQTLERWIRERWHCSIQSFSSQREQGGVVNSYRDPATLGADRWAALLGARTLTKHACIVIDCGTAVTVDVLSSAGVFEGGVIFPGLWLLRESLGSGTAAVGTNVGDNSSCLARATAAGVAAGTLMGLAGAIERIVREQEKILGEAPELIVTGGDATLLIPRLGHTAREVPDLVLKGLASSV